MRLVLDTNVLVSALITTSSPPDLLYRAWDDGSFDLVTSDAQLEELRRVLAYEKLRPFISPDDAEALLETISAAAVIASPLPYIDLSPDPFDNVILATAIAGEADLLVTGDKSGLLELEAVHGIPIVTPRTVLHRLRPGR